MPAFFISPDCVSGQIVRITGPLLPHLRDSLRIRAGECLWLCDGDTRYQVHVTHISREALAGTVLQRQARPSGNLSPVLLAQALLKGDHMDWVIQKATELGVETIIPLITQHTVVRPQPARVAGQQTRWQRVALEAAQQCERWKVPSIARPISFREFCTDREPSRATFFVQERAHHPGLATVGLPPAQDRTFAVIVGPEGGWSEEEVGQAAAVAFTAVSLGPLILRAETAALTALAILQSRLGALG
jgi:16S rRNA (uracil1498-N3)-methyltransferase